mgnify:CR=1 FL=1
MPRLGGLSFVLYACYIIAEEQKVTHLRNSVSCLEPGQTARGLGTKTPTGYPEHDADEANAMGGAMLVPNLSRIAVDDADNLAGEDIS